MSHRPVSGSSTPFLRGAAQAAFEGAGPDALPLSALVVALERRAAEAEQMQATAPVAAVLRTVLAELAPLAGNGTPPPPAARADRWLTAAQVADLLATSERWVYDHGPRLGARHLSRRCVRFSEAAVRRQLERRR